MRKLLSKIMLKLGNYFTYLSKVFYKPPEANVLKKWRRDKGDKKLRLDYGLGKDSIVFDLGAYDGQWASDIYSRYLCRIYCFEPVREFCGNIRKRFQGNADIKVYQLGLSDSTRKENISHNDTGSSIYRGDGTEEIRLIEAAGFMKDNGIGRIDLMKINIEGGEYDLLERLVESDFIGNITNIQVQFHKFVPDAEEKRRIIRDKLKRTHELTYDYEYVWENWKLKQSHELT